VRREKRFEKMKGLRRDKKLENKGRREKRVEKMKGGERKRLLLREKMKGKENIEVGTSRIYDAKVDLCV
jgi:hypothetical protein